MGLWLKKGNTDEFQKHINFILSISGTQFFDDNFAIFKKELRPWTAQPEYWWMDVDQEKRLKERIGLITSGKVPAQRDRQKIVENISSNRVKSKNLKRIGSALRDDISRRLREARASRDQITETWEMFRDRNMKKAGCDLMKRRRLHAPFAYFFIRNTWLEKALYYKEWVSGILYIQHYAMRYPNMPIDQNAQADIQQLIYLKESDAIVSEEEKFMMRAWEDLYKPQGKLYLRISDLARL